MEELNQSTVLLLGGITGLASILMAYFKDYDDSYLSEERRLYDFLFYFLINSLIVVTCSSLYLFLFRSIPWIIDNIFTIGGFLMLLGFSIFIGMMSLQQTMRRFPDWLWRKIRDKKYGNFIHDSYMKVGAVFWMYVIFCVYLAPFIDLSLHIFGWENHNLVNWYFNEVRGSPVLSDDFNILHFLSFYDFGLGIGFIIATLFTVVLISMIGFFFDNA